MKIERRYTHAGAAGNRHPRWKHGARWPSMHTRRKADDRRRRTQTQTHPHPPRKSRRRTHDRCRRPETPSTDPQTHTDPIGNASYAYTEANPTRFPALLHDTFPPLLSSPHLGRPTHSLYSSGSAFRFLDLLHFLAPFFSFLPSGRYVVYETGYSVYWCSIVR
ncbi:hypothetical protein B0H14DRAFT_30409 [Mycena olivaceomarginata]|nr:hypothetical protein B0H14DRAFT_30409 [Mycena olivaceomarginata]